MTFHEYLSIFRRRWIYLALGLIAGLVGGFLTAPGRSDDPVRYEGVHTLLVDDATATGAQINLEQAALLADTGPVPVRVAERLQAEGLPLAVGTRGIADLDLRSLTIRATSSTAEGAERAADLTAEEINAELVAEDKVAYDEQLASLEAQIAVAEAQLRDLDAQLFELDEDDPNRPVLEDRRQTTDASLVTLQSELRSLVEAGPPQPPFTTLEAAEGRPASAEGWKLPETPVARALILGVLGLILGMVGALAADRLDTRIRGKEDAERAVELPVIAEIPPLSNSKSRDLVIANHPASPFSEAYRSLRTVVLFAAGESVPDNGSLPIPSPNGARAQDAKVILITSPAAGEGKTTTAAHLAAVLAEVNKRVLVVSADFRRPRIHDYFGVEREPGLADVLEADQTGVRLSDLQMASSFAGVHLLPSGAPVDNPARLLNESKHLISAARQLFDFIVIDTPPLLVANDATELASVADMLILVAKADRSGRDASRRSTEVLRRVGAPLLGVVVTAAHDTPTAYGYYRYRYYSDTDQGEGKRTRRRRDKGTAQAPAPQPLLPETVGADEV